MGTTAVEPRKRQHEVLTTEETCDLLRITRGQLYSLRYVGKGPRAHRVGKQLRFLYTDVIAWLEAQ